MHVGHSGYGTYGCRVYTLTEECADLGDAQVHDSDGTVFSSSYDYSIVVTGSVIHC